MLKQQMQRLAAPICAALLLWAGDYVGGVSGQVFPIGAVLMSAVVLSLSMVDWENAHGRTTCYSLVPGVAVFFSGLAASVYGLTYWLVSAHAAGILPSFFVGLSALATLVAGHAVLKRGTILDSRTLQEGT